MNNPSILKYATLAAMLLAPGAEVCAKVKAREDTLKKVERTLKEVVVTASENRGVGTSSRIGRSAMNHLQPTSFADLLELLPGNISKDPQMGGVNLITMRETGTVGATGKAVVDRDQGTGALGTLFVIDGAPVSTDGNLGSLGAVGDVRGEGRETMNRGVDMRSIATDDIESVEVVRGIPSVEFGNLTSGMVNIKRKRAASPLTARFKVDGYSKLLSAGKGIALADGESVLNIDAGWLDSKVDPRNPLENYKRLNGGVRFTSVKDLPGAAVRYNINGDYAGSFDDSKVDPDLNLNKIDRYESKYNRMGVNTEVAVSLLRDRWFTDFKLNAGGSLQVDRLNRQRQVSPQRGSIAPAEMQGGAHDTHFILSEYVADYSNDSRPLQMFLKLKAEGGQTSGDVSHRYLAGAEWSRLRNIGAGEVYDISRPLQSGWSLRPRSYTDIPALHTLSFFAEDKIDWHLRVGTVTAQLGVRVSTIPFLDRRYRLAGRWHVDPRVNLLWNLPAAELAGSPLRIGIGGGWGITTKLPTIDYLYPQKQYIDIVQLNYYSVKNPAELSRVNVMTYVNQGVNYDIRGATCRKSEVRLNAGWRGFAVSLTAFAEKTGSGFRYVQDFASYAYTSYSTEGMSSEEILAATGLSQLPGEKRQVLRGVRMPSNSSKTDKLGIEFQGNTPRLPWLRTALTVTGAWFRTDYSSTGLLYQTVSDVVGNVSVSDRYVGIYADEDGRVNEQLSSNVMFDTQLPELGLIFTASLQSVWYLTTTRKWVSGVPVSYISAADGELHPYDTAVETDPLLRYLERSYNPESFRSYTVPPAMFLNLKVTKTVGKGMQVSMFVNRLFDWQKDYVSNGLLVRRQSKPYFGAETQIRF